MTGIQIHDRREKNGISHTNEDIDWTKTEENMDLIEQQERYRTIVSKRIAELELKKKTRSDATVMCQCLVTSDNSFFEKISKEEQILYFKKSLDFIKVRYGEKNLVSATIHYDERTPHMHINFIPVTKDGRLSARDLFSPKQLRTLQDDYNRFIREYGYDLERGQINSKTKHLEVEEYKVATRYNQLKTMEQELNRLEQVDMKADLKAKKGKIVYSTKEVDTIKDQNKALKVECYNKDTSIKDLQDNLSKLDKRLKQVLKEFEGTKEPITRLKDLESENRALQEYRKMNPYIDKSMEGYDHMREQAYKLGNQMVKCKETYQTYLTERERLIARSSVCDKMAKECTSKTKDLVELQKGISYCLAQQKALQAESECLTGVFKKKKREECRNKLEQQEKESQRLEKQLRADHNITPEYITHRLEEYADQKEGFVQEKAESIRKTNKVEKLRDEAVCVYKYYKALSDCQSKNFSEISNRLNTRVNLLPGEEKVFHITRGDRIQILKDMVIKQPQSIVEKCKEVWKIQDYADREIKERLLSKKYIKEQNSGLER